MQKEIRLGLPRMKSTDLPILKQEWLKKESTGMLAGSRDSKATLR